MITPTQMRELSNKYLCLAKSQFQTEIDTEVDRILQECQRVAKSGVTFVSYEYYCNYNHIRKALGTYVDKIMVRLIQQKLEIAGYKVVLHTLTYQYITISW